MKFLDNVKLERIARAGGGMGETKQPLPLHRCDCGQTMRRERSRSNPAEFGEISRVARSGRSIAVTRARCIWGLYIGTMDGWRLWEQIFEGPKSAGRRGEDAREERSAEHPTNEATTFSHFGHFKSGAARRRAEGGRGREGRSRNFTQRSKRAHGVVVSVVGRGCKVNCQRTAGKRSNFLNPFRVTQSQRGRGPLFAPRDSREMCFLCQDE